MRLGSKHVLVPEMLLDQVIVDFILAHFGASLNSLDWTSLSSLTVLIERSWLHLTHIGLALSRLDSGRHGGSLERLRNTVLSSFTG